MIWKKLGKIFDPTEHRLANNCIDFAQSPQTLVFDDFIRIYFSTREKDDSGKYLSHVAYVDFDKGFKRILNMSDKTVIPLGNLGCFDEHGIFPMNVVRNKDKLLAYTTGWNRKRSVSADASIGLAYSEDGGTTFTKFGEGPVLTASLKEPFLVCDAFVTVFRDNYYMWYIYGTKWISDTAGGDPQRVYKIAQARSNDGITWERNSVNIIADKLNEDECQALPTVIFYKDRYHLFFCYRHATGFREIKERGYRIGYAYSDDLATWHRDDDSGGMTVSNEGWDSEMLCYPHVFYCNDNVYMLYNGNEFGRRGFGLAVLEKY
jgi:sucrose-6-phosphate hydrolase SacC (GH32 family)